MANLQKIMKPRTERLQPGKRQSKARRSLAQMFASRDGAVDRNRFEILGQIVLLRTSVGDISFGLRGGPVLARIDADAMDSKIRDQAQPFVLLSEWTGLPEEKLVAAPVQPCPACQRECHYCKGTKKVLCWGIGCGGHGKRILTWEPCAGEGCLRETGDVKLNCATCGGSGQVVGQTAECLACHGHKPEGSEHSVADCAGCHGTGVESTGLLNGALQEDKSAPVCPECDGSGRKMKREAQDWKKFVLGELEGYTVLGPIEAIAVYADELRDPQRKLELWNVSPDDSGNLSALVVARPDQHGQRMYLLGGSIRKM